MLSIKIIQLVTNKLKLFACSAKIVIIICNEIQKKCVSKFILLTHSMHSMQ